MGFQQDDISIAAHKHQAKKQDSDAAVKISLGKNYGNTIH
jgi:hypothetical protein